MGDYKKDAGSSVMVDNIWFIMWLEEEKIVVLIFLLDFEPFGGMSILF